jgi:hypothetical protein
VTGAGFIPGRSPNGTTIVDGYGVFPPLPGQYGARSIGPFADPTSNVRGQTWDHVVATLAGSQPFLTQPVAVSGPDGNGRVIIAINTTWLANGRYTVTITGRLLTQTTSFQVKQTKKG